MEPDRDVYLVTEWDYDGMTLYGAFARRDRAQAYADALNGQEGRAVDVEVWPLRDDEPDLMTVNRFYVIRLDPNGRWAGRRAWAIQEQTRVGNPQEVIPNQSPGTYAVVVPEFSPEQEALALDEARRRNRTAWEGVEQ